MRCIGSIFLLALVFSITHCLLPTRAAAPPARGTRPVVRFIGATKVGAHPGNIRIVFEFVNPTGIPLRFLGFRANSFNPPLPRGRVKPLWIADMWQAGKSKEIRDGSGGCAFGIAKIELAAKTSATFDIELPVGGWDEARVRVIFTPLGEHHGSVGSVTLSKHQIENAMKDASVLFK